MKNIPKSQGYLIPHQLKYSHYQGSRESKVFLIFTMMARVNNSWLLVNFPSNQVYKIIPPNQGSWTLGLEDYSLTMG